MSRLVDADKLYEKAKEFPRGICVAIQMLLSTTECDYDIDKVIEKLEEESYEHYDTPSYSEGQCRQLDLSDAIDIVMSGGTL